MRNRNPVGILDRVRFADQVRGGNRQPFENAGDRILDIAEIAIGRLHSSYRLRRQIVGLR